MDVSKNGLAGSTRPPAGAMQKRTERWIADLNAAVGSAWARVHGRGAFRRGKPWGAADALSDKLVAFALFLEERFGVHLPLDAIDARTTPRAMVVRLIHLLRPPRADEHMAGHGPRVYLLPAIQGDDPAWAQFRRTLDPGLRMRTLGYPGWARIGLDADLSRLVDALYDQVAESGPPGIVHLLGYSFGGVVAFELAQRLHSAGYRIGLLGLIDARRWDLTKEDPHRKFHTFLHEPRSRARDAVKRAVAALVEGRHRHTLHGLRRLAGVASPKLAFWIERQVNKEVRHRMLRTWRPVSTHMPALLFLSNDTWPGDPREQGWLAICPEMQVFHLPCSHEAVFTSPAVRVLREQLLFSLCGTATDR